MANSRSVDYEGKLLGSLIKNNQQIPLAMSLLTEEDFQNVNYKSIYRLIINVFTDKGIVDLVLLADQTDKLNEQVVLEELIKNPEFGNEKFKTYVSEIKRRGKVGRLRELSAQIVEDVKLVENVNSDSKVRSVIGSIQNKLFQIEEDVILDRPTKTDVIEEMKEDIIKYSGKELWGIDTGFETLNTISKGIAPQQLWVVGAYTSIGKSFWSLHLAKEIAKQGIPVLYISTEMSEKRLYWRLASMLTEMSEFDLIFKNLDLVQNAKREQVFSKIDKLPVEIVSGIVDTPQAVFEIKKHKAQNKVQVVIIDFLQNLAADKDEYETVTSAIRTLQNAAIREDVAIIVASQNNRESQKEEFESLRGFKGSGAIETCADLAIVLSRPKDVNLKKNRLICDVQKNRNGFTGTFLLEIDLAIGKMKDLGFCDQKGELINDK